MPSVHVGQAEQSAITLPHQLSPYENFVTNSTHNNKQTVSLMKWVYYAQNRSSIMNSHPSDQPVLHEL